MIRNWLLIVSAALGLGLTAAPAQAIPLAPGGFGFASGAPLPAGSVLVGGPVVTPVTLLSGFSVPTGSGILTNYVLLEPVGGGGTGALTFVIEVANLVGPPATVISSLTSADFTGFDLPGGVLDIDYDRTIGGPSAP